MSSTSQALPTRAGIQSGLLHATTGRGLRMDLDVYRLALFLLSVITFSRVHQRFTILAAFRPGLLLVCIAAGYALLNPARLAPGSPFRAPSAKVMAALGVLACLSVPFGISMGAAGLFIISDYSKTLIFGLLIILAIRSARDLYTFAWAYVAGTAVLCWMAIFLFHLSTMGSKAARLGRLYGWDSNDVGVIMVIGLPLTLLTFQTSGRVGRLVSAGLLVAIGVTVGRTGSRGAFLGVVAVGIALLFLSNSVSVVKRLAFLGAVAGALLLWAPPGYLAQMGTLVKPKEDYNWSAADGRKEVAVRGAQYMMSYPIFGLGINNFSKAECFESDKARNHVAGTGIRCTAAHNSYVQAGAELGIPGLALWLMLVFGGIVGMLKLRRKLPPAMARGSQEERFLYMAPTYLAVAMIGFAVSATFVSFAWLDPVYYLGAMMAGVWVVTGRRLAAHGGNAGPQARLPGWRHQQSK